MSVLNFNITHEDKNCKARCGLIKTPHGDIETPIFMPINSILHSFIKIKI